MGDQGMTAYGAEGNSTCTTTLRGSSIADGGLQLWQKTTRPKPLPRGSQAVTSHPAVSKAKQKEMGNFFFSSIHTPHSPTLPFNASSLQAPLPPFAFQHTATSPNKLCKGKSGAT